MEDSGEPQQPPTGGEDKEKVDAPKMEDKPDADAPAAVDDNVEETKNDKKRAKEEEPADEKEAEKSPSRSKRSRKSAEAFVPEDFLHVDRSLDVALGRGKRLGDLEEVRESVNSFPITSEDLLTAHRLLFPGHRKPPRKEIKANILSFSGYLKKKKKDQDEKELEKEDEEAETKMSVKAYKMTVPQLKKMCDFFAIDRKGKNDKDGIVDCLLDFLGAPSESMLKGYKAAEKSSKKSAKQKEDEKDYEVIEFGTMPNDKQLRQWVRAYVRCFNLEKVTIKHALQVAAEKFGVDLASKKDTLRQLLCEEM